MLAQSSKIAWMALAAIALMGANMMAQSPNQPSQNYQPTPPPSVHVAPNGARPLTQRQPVNYRLTDGTVNQRRSSRNQIRQTSYVQGEQVQVPSILAGTKPVSQAIPKPKTPQDYAAQLQRYTPVGSQPVATTPAAPVEKATPAGINVDPDSLATQTQQMQQQIEFARQRMQEQQDSITQARQAVEQAMKAQEMPEVEQVIQPMALPVAQMPEQLPVPETQPISAPFEVPPTSGTEFQAPQIEMPYPQTEQTFEPFQTPTVSRKEMQQWAEEVMEVQVVEGQIEEPVALQVPAPTVDHSIPRLTAKQEPAPVQEEIRTAQAVPTVPATIDVPVNHVRSATEKPAKIRQASATTEVTPVRTAVPDAKINLGSPSILVQTYGPTKIGINKISKYKITVTNRSAQPAERILVGVNMPAWIDLQNINLSNGSKEVTDGTQQARLVWTVDRIPPKSTQEIIIDAIPRRAEVFDLGVEWTLVPRVGLAHVEVTEPRLEMKIFGPNEVQYGQKAKYSVTVRNPGTGAAENVKVKLPEALGGESANLGLIPAGQEREFEVELLARTAGALELVATATADGQLKTAADQAITVRRADIRIGVTGPPMKYAGSVGQYTINVVNSGDATATDIQAAVALPAGVKFLGGVEAVNQMEGGLKWSVGSLEPGEQRQYKINCQLDASGDLQIEVGARGAGELAAASSCQTTVETVADLVLSVADPKGPLPTGQNVDYEIRIKNRGSRSARGLNLVMQFSKGIEPTKAAGLSHRIVTGQVLFAPISQIDPGQELTYRVSASALTSGTHVFRAQLTCDDSEAREVAEGTTRFFGDDVQQQQQQIGEQDNDTADSTNDFAPGVNR